MDTLPLLSHRSPAAVVAYRSGIPVTARRFLADAAHLARNLPAGRHVLNVCADRYRFTVGLAACLMTGRVSLLPSTHTPEVIGQLASFAPDAFCLTDDHRCDIALPRFHYPRELPPAEIAGADLAAAEFAGPRPPGRPRKSRRPSSRPSSSPRDPPAHRCPTRKPGAGSRVAFGTARLIWDCPMAEPMSSSAPCRRSICTALNPRFCSPCRAAMPSARNGLFIRRISPPPWPRFPGRGYW